MGDFNDLNDKGLFSPLITYKVRCRPQTLSIATVSVKDITATPDPSGFRTVTKELKVAFDATHLQYYEHKVVEAWVDAATPVVDY